jgi:cell division protein YceG involved in septum cleavage
MYKLWKKYSYAIILLVFSFLGIFILSYQLQSPQEGHYLKIKINKGDSLWAIAKEYEQKHHLTETEFVNWVENYNGITGDRIYSGEELYIPIKKTSRENMEIIDIASQ